MLKFILQALIQSAQHLYEERKDLDPLASGSGSGSGRPKDMRILRIRIPNTGFNKYSHRAVQQTILLKIMNTYGSEK
jgi:hypothetical protein